MLRDFIENGHYIFVDKVDSWQDAIRKSCEPIIKDGTVTKEYPEEIVECVGKYGPYIVLMPGVAMPHSQESTKNVNKTTISFMKLQEPVSFDENDDEKYADLFFTLASCDHDKHLENMAKLSELLMNEELVEKLHDIKNLDDLKKLSEEFNM